MSRHAQEHCHMLLLRGWVASVTGAGDEVLEDSGKVSPMWRWVQGSEELSQKSTS